MEKLALFDCMQPGPHPPQRIKRDACVVQAARLVNRATSYMYSLAANSGNETENGSERERSHPGHGPCHTGRGRRRNVRKDLETGIPDLVRRSHTKKLWNPMEPYLEPYGTLWNPMEPYFEPYGTLFGTLWNPMEPYGTLWNPIWNPME